MESSFNRQHLTFSILFAVLVTAATLPVIALHYIKTLSGSTVAILAIVGLLISDCVMIFSTWWSVRGPAPLIRVTSMCVKYAIAVCAILTAAAVLVTMRYDAQRETSASQASSARVAEIEARKVAAIELTKAGSRQAGREIARMDRQSPEVLTTPPAPLPDWVMSFGVFVLLPLVSIAGAIALSISASIATGPGPGLAENLLPLPSPSSVKDGGTAPIFARTAKKK